MFDLIKIEDPNFIKSLNNKELKILADEIREFLINSIKKTGGHLSSNLGTVELTIAIHYCFNLNQDKILFDCSHQSYTHKILTGRAKDFDKLRKTDGLNGFSSKAESKYDFFDAGHCSTSISFQAGFILSNKYQNKKGYVISVIGDASISNGLAFEGINFLGTFKNQNAIVILNDNKMGISKTKGSLSRFLSSIRINKFYLKIKEIFLKITPKFLRAFVRKITRSIKGLIQYKNIFEDLGFRYIGPLDGHNISQLINYISKAKEINEPTIIHCITKKGKGYKDAENDIEGKYHGIDPNVKDINKESFSEIITESLIKLQKEEQLNIIAISSAMLEGSKLYKYQKLFPNLVIDCGISEEHAATMAGALALDNNNVFLSYYSTFSQRAFDEIIHDISMQNAKIVIGLDRANLVGEDGKTHQGIYDLAMFSIIPNTTICMPSNQSEAYSLLRYGYLVNNKVFVIRYSKDKIIKSSIINENYLKPFWKIERKKSSNCVIITYGNAVNRIRNLNLNATLVNALFIKPLDLDILNEVLSYNIPIIVYEEVVESNNLYQQISKYIMSKNLSFNKLYKMCLPNDFVEFGQVSDLLKKYKLSDEDIINKYIKITGGK